MGLDEQEDLLCALLMKMEKDIEILRKMLNKTRGGKKIDDEQLLKILRKFSNAKGQG